ncbi:tetratricopeptide repeat protein [Arcobacter vandammei]|uniref:tetratricopeptide repeat protein n=1 Tax=Arcobacter vandammei TaxID=2782243 RepID=UPI0018E0089C|nr:SEL1-like repeat protein [Arcobacter vandammei]
MKKQILISTILAFIFSACSMKMPEMLSFGSSSNYDEPLKEANICQKLEKDNEKLACYRKIENTNSFAQIRLGTHYADKKDYVNALKYLNMAKKNENIYANLPISFLYYKGDGVNKDINRSFELLNEASSVDPVAAYQLSRFYLQGINTKVDVEKGMELLLFSGEKGVRQAQDMLVNIYKTGLFDQPKDGVKYNFWLKKLNDNIEDNNHKIYVL